MKLRAKTVVPGKYRNLFRQRTTTARYNRPLTNKRVVIIQNCITHHPIGSPLEINRWVKKASRLTKNFQAIQEPSEDERESTMSPTGAFATSNSTLPILNDVPDQTATTTSVKSFVPVVPQTEQENPLNVERRLSTPQEARIFDSIQIPMASTNIATNSEIQSSSQTDSRPKNECDNTEGSSSPVIPELCRFEDNDPEKSRENELKREPETASVDSGRQIPSGSAPARSDAFRSRLARRLQRAWEKKFLHQCRIILEYMYRMNSFINSNLGNFGDVLLPLQEHKRVFIQCTQKTVLANRNGETRQVPFLCDKNPNVKEIITID